MIFYHRARFVTDFSGDQGFVPVNNTAYSKATPDALGSSPAPESPIFIESRGIISSSSPPLVSAMSYFPDVDLPIPEFKDQSVVSSPQFEQSAPLPLPVCGLGGVYPADNHVFYPKHRQIVRKRKHQSSFSLGPVQKIRKFIRSKFFATDTELREYVSAQDQLEIRLEGAGPVQHAELTPSGLPPPSYVQIPSSSSQEDDSWPSDADEADGELSGDTSGGDQMPDFAPPALMLTHEETAMDSGSEDYTDDDAMDEDDDDEIDLLAHDRALNAEEVAMREREFEETLRDPSPDAKSSQATVGDRSFLSDEEDEQRRIPERQERRRHTRTGSKRGREEVEGAGAVPSSPAKRIETPRTKDGRK